MNTLIDNGLLERRSSIRKKDTIDISAYGKEHCYGNYAAMPEMQMSDEEREAWISNWTLAVPPILDGVVLLNKDRYLVYEVHDIDLDDKKYNVQIIDYGFDQGIWILNHIVVGDIHCDVDEKTFDYRDIDVADIFKGYFVTHELTPYIELDKVTTEILVNVILPDMERVNAEDAKNGDSEAKDILNHFFTTIVRVNHELSSNKPKAVRKKDSNTKVKAIKDAEPDKNPKPQIIRTLPSGVTIKSENIPKAPTLEIIRHYKIASWGRRGHLRHYKNGKVVYIAPCIAKRKDFDSETVVKRQKIIVSGRK